MHEDRWGAERFNDWANFLVRYCNFTVAMIVLIVIVLLYSILHMWKKPSGCHISTQLLVILHSTATLYVGISALAAFTLTKAPPLARVFEPNEWRAVGAYIFLAGLFYGLYHTARIFRMPFGKATP